MAKPKQVKGRTIQTKVPIPAPATKPPAKTKMGGSR